MIVALVDNGSIEAAAHHNLRAVADLIGRRVGCQVHAVSWRHSDRIAADALKGVAALTLAPWLTGQLAAGERQFIFIPFFISAQGAIGSALRRDLAQFQQSAVDFKFTFCDGLAARGAIAEIVAARIRETIATQGLSQPPVIVVDHGGPSPSSASLRDELTATIQAELKTEVGRVAATSMEGDDHPHNHPLFAAQLVALGFERGDVVIAPLFLSPGKHAGPDGDLARIARKACEQGNPRTNPRRCHFTDLIGSHSLAAEVLATSLRETLANLSAPS